MNDWITSLFKGIMADETIEKVSADFPAYADVLLSQLGVDSMAVMGLVLNLESVFGVRVDYAAFDVRVLRTLGSIREYLTTLGVAT